MTMLPKGYRYSRFKNLRFSEPEFVEVQKDDTTYSAYNQSGRYMFYITFTTDMYQELDYVVHRRDAKILRSEPSLCIYVVCADETQRTYIVYDKKRRDFYEIVINLQQSKDFLEYEFINRIKIFDRKAHLR